MENSSKDRRVRKTKAVLRQGLVRLMSEKSVKEITVKELCIECDINRGTFYSHYTDVYDLLQKIEEDLLSALENVMQEYPLMEVSARSARSPILSNVFCFLAENADMARILLCNNGDMAFVEKVKDSVKNKFMREWRMNMGDSHLDDSEYLYAFIVSGCIGVLQQWLLTNCKQPAQELADVVQNILVRGVVSGKWSGEEGAGL